MFLAVEACIGTMPPSPDLHELAYNRHELGRTYRILNAQNIIVRNVSNHCVTIEQATWFTDGRGAVPTEAMLEASFRLLTQAWAHDPDRRAYQEVGIALCS